MLKENIPLNAQLNYFTTKTALMEFNWFVLIFAAFIPLAVGFVWYHPKVFGKAWMNASGQTESTFKSGNMGVTLGVSLIFSLLLSLMLSTMTIHQFHITSILLDEPGFGDPQSEIGQYFTNFLARFGRNFRTFQHGALHGTLAGILFALPVLGTNALFERKGFRYIAINSGYWILSAALMGGVICAFL